ncbi:hypothetical protein MBLNU13_g01897t2 [Cladosporium sp. NU13]
MPRLLTQGQLTPVCCVTDVSEELKDRFLLVNIDFADQLDHSFVFVDDPSTIYAEKNDVGENTSSQANPSFKNKSADECWLLLRQMREAGSNIDYESFVIIDDRTLQDDTVLVVVKELLTEDEAAQATNAEVRTIIGEIGVDTIKSLRPLLIVLGPRSGDMLMEIRDERQRLSARVVEVIHTFGLETFHELEWEDSDAIDFSSER